MALKWRKHEYPGGALLFSATVATSIEPAQSAAMFEQAWRKFFRELGRREELSDKKGVTCCVEITSGDFTLYAFKGNPRSRSGTHVGVTFPFANRTTSDLFDRTEGDPPFDEIVDKLTADYVRALRETFASQGKSELQLIVIDPEGVPL